MTLRMTIGKYDITFKTHAKCELNHFKIHRRDGGKHIVWWKFSLLIEDWKAEIYPICAECGSQGIGEIGCGNEGWSFCESCRSVECGYVYVNKREYDKAN